MIWLRSFLLLGLIAHKAVWEMLGRKNRAAREPFRPIKALKVALLLGFLLQVFLPPLFPIAAVPAGLQVASGVVLFTAGLALAVTARCQLGRNWANVESATVLPDQLLVARGVYRFVRHPIYLGDLALVTGFELALNSWLVVLAVPLAIYVWRKAAQEEQLLASKLPGYVDYLRRSGRFLPRVAPAARYRSGGGGKR